MISMVWVQGWLEPGKDGGKGKRTYTVFQHRMWTQTGAPKNGLQFNEHFANIYSVQGTAFASLKQITPPYKEAAFPPGVRLTAYQVLFWCDGCSARGWCCPCPRKPGCSSCAGSSIPSSNTDWPAHADHKTSLGLFG